MKRKHPGLYETETSRPVRNGNIQAYIKWRHPGLHKMETSWPLSNAYPDRFPMGESGQSLNL